MASQLEHSDIIKQVKARKVAQEEQDILKYVDAMDKLIGEYIKRATVVPITYTIPFALDPVHIKAWERLKTKYQEKWGSDKCHMVLEPREVKHDLGRGHWNIGTDTYGKFILKE